MRQVMSSRSGPGKYRRHLRYRFIYDKMKKFSSALGELRKSSSEYEEALKKTSEANSILRVTVDKMATALEEMKHIFNHTKCGICCSRDQNTALMCGHCLCSICALKAVRDGRCPFCRRPMTESMRLYM